MLALDGEVVAEAAGAAVEAAGAEGGVHGGGLADDDVVDAVEEGERAAGVVGLEVGGVAADADARAAVVVLEGEGAEADEADVEGGDGDVAGLEARLYQVLRVGELEARVGEHVEEEAVALAEDDADAVVGEGLDALDLAEVALEVGGGADFAVDLVAVEGEVEPELDVRGGEGRAVVPGDVIAEGEGPLGVAGVDGPGGGEVGAGEVEVLPAAHDEVAGAEEGAADVVEGDAAGAHGVEAGGGVAAVGEDEDATVGAVGGRWLRGGGGERRDGGRRGGRRGGSKGGRCGGNGSRGDSPARSGRGVIGGGAGRREGEGEAQGERDGGSKLHATIVVGERSGSKAATHS